MMQLPESVIDEIFERGLKIQQRVSSPEYIKFLLRYKQLSSVFELQYQETSKVIGSYHQLVKSYLTNNIEEMNQSLRCTNDQQKVKPLLTWRLQNLNLTQNFYKDSDTFFHDGIDWKMFIQKLNDKECQIGLKYAQEFNREMQTRD